MTRYLRNLGLSIWHDNVVDAVIYTRHVLNSELSLCEDCDGTPSMILMPNCEIYMRMKANS